MTKSLGGMYAALMTAMDEDGGFSPERQRGLDACVLGQGLAGLYVAGSSGESGLMESAELAALLAVVAEDARASGATLIAHVGQPALEPTLRLAREAERLGYHAISALPPHAYPFSDAEILAFYKALAAATSLPLIGYEIPVRTGRPLPTALLLDILDLPGVAGLKFSSSDLFKFGALRRARPDKTFYFGSDEIWGGAALIGADGGIGTTYNLLGKLYVALEAALAESNVARARALQDISARFVEVLLDVGVMPGMKAGFAHIGVDVGPSRRPMALRGAGAEAKVAAFLSQPEVAEWLP
ncbi:MAG: dihydrodipicolinate synthase family protein [Vannielia sp.]|uniref:dihydrodipicolinate synthase family protein n=1 Tax=Rhodobacterales TaxID=204455 RepID=UPI002094C44E|nr:dihydrodipicolinate synthase family protein [Oceanicola sp. 502str15]MCO6381119.1 N-acetylneuraminate lyase [Oceanicola sp. 502str15]